MYRSLVGFCLILLLTTMLPASTAFAQGGRLQNTTAIFAYSTDSVVGRVQIAAQGTAISYTPQLEVAVPAGLVVESGMSCQALYSDISDGSISAKTDLGCTAEAVVMSSGVTWVVSRATTEGGFGFNKVEVSFSVRFPADVPAGTTYTVSAPTSGLDVSTADITAPNQTPATREATQTPLPAERPLAEATLIPNGARSESPLVFIPSSVDARVGEPITLDIDWVRLQGVESVAVMVYAEAMKITNVDMTLIDLAGQSACSSGTEGDLVRPRERAFDVFEEPDRLPTEFDLVIRPSARPGDQLQVCMEMVLFSGDRELTSWNATATVNVVAR